MGEVIPFVAATRDRARDGRWAIKVTRRHKGGHLEGSLTGPEWHHRYRWRYIHPHGICVWYDAFVIEEQHRRGEAAPMLTGAGVPPDCDKRLVWDLIDRNR